jgi:hypothetical protein
MSMRLRVQLLKMIFLEIKNMHKTMMYKFEIFGGKATVAIIIVNHFKSLRFKIDI